MARPRQERCLNGHYIAEVGRLVGGGCRACYRVRSRDYSAEARARKGAKRRPLLEREMLPVAPLVPFVSGRHDRLNSRMLDAWTRSRYRNSARITVALADEICTALGYHPSEIFGELWWQEATG